MGYSIIIKGYVKHPTSIAIGNVQSLKNLSIYLFIQLVNMMQSNNELDETHPLNRVKKAKL